MRVDTPLARVLAFLFPAVFVAAMTLIVSLAIRNRGVEDFGVLALVSAFAGTAAGLFVLQQSLSQYDNQVIKRERTIAEMNHNIRNALTVLLFYGTRGEDQQARVAVTLAVQRIEWTLETILPEGWSQEPESHKTQKCF